MLSYTKLLRCLRFLFYNRFVPFVLAGLLSSSRQSSFLMVPFRSVRNHVSKIKVKNETPEEGYAELPTDLVRCCHLCSLYIFRSTNHFLTFDYVLVLWSPSRAQPQVELDFDRSIYIVIQ
jgi:hypothetical protein